MRILLINNEGGGFADYQDVTPGTTVEKLFNETISSGRADDYMLRVNRQPVARGQVLQEGDRVSITPLKIQGRARRVNTCVRNSPRPRKPLGLSG